MDYFFAERQLYYSKGAKTNDRKPPRKKDHMPLYKRARKENQKNLAS